MKYTKESVKARHLWRAEHVEMNWRHNTLWANTLLFSMFILGVGLGLSKPNDWVALGFALWGGGVFFYALIWDRKWEAAHGVPKLVKKSDQDRAPPVGRPLA